jgi:hypothetical protein
MNNLLTLGTIILQCSQTWGTIQGSLEVSEDSRQNFHFTASRCNSDSQWGGRYPCALARGDILTFEGSPYNTHLDSGATLAFGSMRPLVFEDRDSPMMLDFAPQNCVGLPTLN